MEAYAFVTILVFWSFSHSAWQLLQKSWNYHGSQNIKIFWTQHSSALPVGESMFTWSPLPQYAFWTYLLSTDTWEYSPAECAHSTHNPRHSSHLLWWQSSQRFYDSSQGNLGLFGHVRGAGNIVRCASDVPGACVTWGTKKKAPQISVQIKFTFKKRNEDTLNCVAKPQIILA